MHFGKWAKISHFLPKTGALAWDKEGSFPFLAKLPCVYPAVNKTRVGPTCPLLDGRADLPTEEDVDVIEDELHHHRLDPHFHEGCGAAEAGRLDLFGPGEWHSVPVSESQSWRSWRAFLFYFFTCKSQRNQRKTTYFHSALAKCQWPVLGRYSEKHRLILHLQSVLTKLWGARLSFKMTGPTEGPGSNATHLSRLGAQTIARFFACIFVMEQ